MRRKNAWKKNGLKLGLKVEPEKQKMAGYFQTEGSYEQKWKKQFQLHETTACRVERERARKSDPLKSVLNSLPVFPYRQTMGSHRNLLGLKMYFNYKNNILEHVHCTVYA